MIGPRWRKVWRDLVARPGRSLLAVLAMAAGVFEIGAMLYKYALLQPELGSMYGRTHPASATLVLDAAAVSDALIDSVRRVPGVTAAEVRPVVMARVRVGEDEWVPAVLYVVRDFDRQQIDTFKPQAGAWPPGASDVLLERSALQVAKVAVGDDITLRLEGVDDRTLKVAGTVHAEGLAPAWMEHMVPGFVAWSSVVRGAEHGERAQIRIVTDHPLEEGRVREVADSTRAMLDRAGYTVTRLNVPTPGKHPHADQMAAFLYLLLAFGILSFALGTVLVASMIHGLMTEQMKQIGMMKAIGATDRQVAGIYLGYVAVLAAAALAIGMPAGLVVGRAYAEFAAGVLNADITQAPFPWWLVAAELAAGLVVPLLVALGPVARAARITVREALSDDFGPRPFGAGAVERWFAGLRGVPRPLALSLRTLVARPARLALTVLTMAVGGAAFVAALNVAAAWTRAVDRDFEQRRFDLAMGFAEAQPIASLRDAFAAVAEVQHAEFWPGASPYLIGADGVPGGAVSLFGPPPGSDLLRLPLVDGRWLEPADANAAVVNRALLSRHPGLGVGDSVRVRLRGRDLAFSIVGIVRELAPMPAIYAPSPAVYAATGQSSALARSARIVTRGHDDPGQRAAARALEREFERRGIEVTGMQRMLDMRQGILDHLVIIMAVLTFASVIVVFVGGLALASTLTVSVVQRTREIGVLGAIGAAPRTIALHVWIEALLLGLASWVVAMALAVPVSWALQTATGRIFFRSPLEFTFSAAAAGVWLAIVVVIASIASFYPARRAARLTVREALQHV